MRAIETQQAVSRAFARADARSQMSRRLMFHVSRTTLREAKAERRRKLMPTYVSLLRYTDQGIRKTLERPIAARLRQEGIQGSRR